MALPKFSNELVAISRKLGLLADEAMEQATVNAASHQQEYFFLGIAKELKDLSQKTEDIRQQVNRRVAL